jgi:hypothetical protein
MNLRTATIEKASVAVIALVAGLLGGVIHDWMRGGTVEPAASSTPDVLRAKRFEVISASGQTLSYWGPDSDPHIPASTPRGVLLVFMDVKGTRRCQIGSRIGDFGPELLFYDKDGPLPGNQRQYSDPRFAVGLGYNDDPALAMRNKTSWRILLGAQHGDAPDPSEDTWSLRIRGGQTAEAGVTGYRTYFGQYTAGLWDRIKRNPGVCQPIFDLV